ncbi:MAG: type II toxin-antitoxin system VapC family toxin [Thermodesulfobacteriota bacterium]|nr:type II toxin-antitoxin system VapC family toxin [Thermodesulfobacteriota bacterium]
MVYVDTSVLVAYYCPEELSQQAQAVLLSQAKPALSVLTEVELTSAVARKVRMNELDSAAGQRVLAKFGSHVAAGLFEVMAVENHHWQLAKSWIGLFATPLRTLDALHLAMAADAALELVTSDKSFFQSAEMLGVAARLLE